MVNPKGTKYTQSFTNAELKSLIRQYKSQNCQPFSKLNKKELIEYILKVQKLKDIYEKLKSKKDPMKKGTAQITDFIEEEKEPEPQKEPESDIITIKKKKKVRKDKQQESSDNLIDNIKLIISKYNKDEIKKQNLKKENLKNFTDPYFELFEKIEKQLESIDDKMEWFQNNKKLGEDYVDVKKNFMRRIKSQLKKSKKDKSEKPESEKKKSKKLGWFDALKKYQEENKGVYVIPKKGTAEYKRVKEIQMEGK